MAAASASRQSLLGGRQARLHRSQAARHPQHRRARDGADRPARRDISSPSTPIRRRCARRSRARKGSGLKLLGGLGADFQRRRRSRGSRLRVRRERAGRAARASKRREAGVDGLVASAAEAAMLRAAIGDVALLVTPGIRPAGAAAGDQKRVATPARRSRDGADYLVVGRP